MANDPPVPDPTAPDPTAPGPHLQPPTSDAVQSNVALANSYRLELNKQLIAIATALFAFTTAFYATPSATTPLAAARAALLAQLALTGWIGLAVSIVCGLLVMWAWEAFYMSYRKDYHLKHEEAEARRKTLTAWRRGLGTLQWFGFIVGVACVAGFAIYRITPP